jgi:hypothetical protein
MKIMISQLQKTKVYIFFLIKTMLLVQLLPLQAQVSGSLEKRISIGSLQSHFTAYGAERAWNNTWYAGIDWPADYLKQDNAVIERSWLAADNFTDVDEKNWEKYGIYISAGYVGESLFPVVHNQVAKIQFPTVIVDGVDINSIIAEEVDSVDATIIPDRIVTNIVNTSMGLTMQRRIYAFSQQYHDNYFIKEYTFTNTGNIDYDDDIELNADLNGVRVSWGVRYSVCRDGAEKYDNQQSWGKYTWVSRRGEDYPAHAGEQITEANPIVDWLRCGFAWSGQSDRRPDWDNIGAPDKDGNGRLAAPQHAGIVTIHVDRSWADSTDDPNQPAVLGWHAGDTYPSIGDMQDVTPMIQLYDMMSGNPHGGANNGGTNRFYEDNTSSITDPVSPWAIHGDGGGTNIWIAYGPFDIPFGESIRIIEAEAVNGINRELCNEIGARWLEAFKDPSDTGPFDLPPGMGTTSDKDIYKNSWFYTGVDSILETFGRAKRNFDLSYLIPQPPLPPAYVEITSGGDRINISWQASESENEPDFAGYKIFRAVGKADTTYEEIYRGDKGILSYDDTSPIRGFAYYYYVVAFNDGSNNTTGEANPTGELISGRFYTQTTEPAFLRREAGKFLKDIRVVPNPYNIKARDLNYPEEEDKIGFYNIPAFCTIKIFTERGDLIETLEHTDGSGDEYWNSITSSRQTVVSGLYIAYFEVTRDYYDPETGALLYKKGDNTFKKFIIIR